MIKVHIKRASDGFVEDFKVSGHAGFAEYGEDIVCSAVSAVVLTAVGYAESLYNPDDTPSLQCFIQNDGLMSWHRPNGLDADMRERLRTVFEAMVYGLKQICENYGNKYLVVFD